MSIPVYDAETGRVWKSEHLRDGEGLLKASRTKNFWEVMEMVVNLWIKKNPQKWDSYLIHLEATKKDQKVKSGAWGRHYRGWSRTDGIDRRLIVDFPIWIMMAIKKLYPAKWGEVRSDKKFYETFARKFPVFAVFKKV